MLHDGLGHRCYLRFRLGFTLNGPLVGGASRRSPGSWAGRNRFRSLYITGTLNNCNRSAVFLDLRFQRLAPGFRSPVHAFWNVITGLPSKFWISLLADGTIVRAATANHDSADRGSTHTAGFSGALIDAMFQLKEAAHAFRVDIIGYRGPAQADGVLQHLDKR